MNAYSQDLRKRVLETVERGAGSLRQIARRFLVSLSFVTRLLRRYRKHRLARVQTAGSGHPAALGPQEIKRLRELVAKPPDATA